MERIRSIEVPVIYEGENKWLVLNHLGNAGNLRAVHISKPRQIHEKDSHHCNEVTAKSSIRYHPKRWIIN